MTITDVRTNYVNRHVKNVQALKLALDNGSVFTVEEIKMFLFKEKNNV